MTGNAIATKAGHVIELQSEADLQALAPVPAVTPISAGQLDRTARMTPRINRQAPPETIAPAAAAIAELDEVERFEAFRIGNRIAAGREKAQQFEGSLHGLKDQVSLATNFQNIGGDRRIIALELGRLGRIKRVQVWTCFDQRWRGYEWEGGGRTDIEENFPADFPLDQALRNDRFVLLTSSSVSRSTKCSIGVQLTNADHALHDLGRRGFAVLRYEAFGKALMAPQMSAAKRTDKVTAKSAGRRWWLPVAKYGALVLVLTLLVLSTI